MKWYINIKVVMVVVLAGGLACLALGIFWGKSIERKKCIKALSSIESRLDSLEITIYPKWEWDPEMRRWEKSK